MDGATAGTHVTDRRTSIVGRAEPPTAESVLSAVGGRLGVAESALPAAVFVVAVVVTGDDTRLSAILAVGLAAVLAAARIVRRQTPIYALSGVIGVAIAGYVASRTGEAADFFLPGLLLNVAYASAYAISIAVRWPLIGVILGLAGGRWDSSWRRDPGLVRAYSRASWIWVALFLLRLAVQLPLYLADALVALGTARVAMGLPLFAVGVWLSWLVLRGTAISVRQPPAEPGP